MIKKTTTLVLTKRPISWQHAYVHRAFGKGKLVKFLSKRAKEFKEYVQTEWKDTYGEDCYYKDTLLSVEIRLELKGKRKLDIDNSTKLLFDSLNGLVYDDDSQIMDLCIHKTMNADTDVITVIFTPIYK